jgi:Ni/Co efflux regulator RcnB
MNKKTLISALALSAVMGTAVALPTTASAHEIVKEKRVTVIKKTQRHDEHRRGDVDRWYIERHREVISRWEPPRYGHRYHRKDRGHGHKYGHRERRIERHDYRPVQQYRVVPRHNDGVRVRIDYDFWL